MPFGCRSAKHAWHHRMMADARRRIIGAVLLSMAGAGLSLALLTALHASLGTAAVFAFDHAGQAWVHGWASPALNPVMLAFTGLGAVATFLPAVAFVLVGLLVDGDRWRAAILAFAMAGALALNEGLKLHFHRARPAVAWAIGDERTYSFPSGHSLFAVALYGTLTCLAWPASTLARRCGLAVVAVVLAAAIGLSRVYLGMHWPTDLLAGYAVGAVWVATVAAVERAWTRSTV